MAELLVAARDLESGYKRGDIITVQDDGWTWGAEETLPNFQVVELPLVPKLTFIESTKPLVRVAGPSDPEWDSPDAVDRFVRLHRRQHRLLLDEFPDQARITTTFAALRPHLRKINRSDLGVSDELGV